MSRERRWYWGIRAGLIGGLVGILTVLWTVVGRQAQILVSSGNDCGCSVAPIQWPLSVVIGTSAVVLAASLLTLRTIVAIAKRIYRHRRLERQLVHRGRRLWHHGAQLSYVVIERPTEEAMTLGLFRPRIIVTTGLIQRLRGTEFTSVLRHEQAHARGFDPLWSLLLEAVGETIGWVGGVRALINSAFSVREVLADEYATKQYTHVAGLSGAIAKLATAAHPQAVPAFSPNNDRVNKLLDRSWQLPLPRVHWRVVVLGFILAVGIFAVGRLPSATAASQPTLPAEACWLRQTMCAGQPTQPVIFMSPTGVMSRYGW